ncbi:MAG TPA: sigma-70 family RNA polymerase sigma factor [Candidatus Limnocylindria bacterium]|jgi:RNA polymerase sigma factor for flagellar operon FliA|nr:sigma-70 family RNA polymerase sigma factor [Candidatus Limnocylindria bacterium]
MSARPQDTDERILTHLGFARAVASRALDPRCRGADREDLIAAGVVGLVQAAQRYRGDLGASFGAYAARRVRGQVLDALRERDPLTRSARRAYREAQRISEDLPPPYVEISLDRLAELGDSGVAAPDATEAPRTRRDPRWDCVVRELRSLTKLERRVIVLSYGRGLTLREIGVQVGLSESGVCRVRARALRRLRSALADEREAA